MGRRKHITFTFKIDGFGQVHWSVPMREITRTLKWLAYAVAVAGAVIKALKGGLL